MGEKKPHPKRFGINVNLKERKEIYRRVRSFSLVGL